MYEDFDRNASGAYDGTAAKAMRNVTREKKRVKRSHDTPYDPEEARFYRFLRTVFAMAELAGYHIDNRVEVTDLNTGRQFK